MIKYCFILINTLGYLLFGWFQTEDPVKLSGSIPVSITVGQEVPLEFRIEKGSRSGFARLQLDLPAGFSIKEAEEKGSNYSFDEGVAKWVWASLPEENSITVKLSIIASESAVGPQVITAKYSFVENNVKEVVEMDPVNVTVLSAGADNMAAVTHAAITETPKDSVNPMMPDTSTAAQANESVRDVKAERILGPGDNINEFKITIRINKGATKGFARYSDDLPATVTARSLKTDGSSFSVADNKVKFVWVNVPEKEELEIIYILSSSSSDPLVLRGEYSYLEDNQSKKYRLDPESIAFQEDKKEEPVAAKNEEKTEPEPVKETPEPARQTETKISRNETDVVYYVQVGAFKKGRNAASRLKKKFKINEELRSEMHEGYSKFMIGSHPTYSNARNHRDDVKNNNGVKSAFVVAYHLGKRITVQEALMISKQQWFK